MEKLEYSYSFKTELNGETKVKVGEIKSTTQAPMCLHAIGQPLVHDLWVQKETLIKRVEELEKQLGEK